MILFLFLCSLIGLCQSQGGGPAAVEYVLNFESAIYTCPDDLSMASMNTSKLEILSHNETTSSIVGNMIFLKELPSHAFRIEVIAKKEVSGKFEVVVTKEICDLCAELDAGSEYWKYIKCFGLPPKCPFPPGEYYINNFAPHKDDLPINSANAARYQVTIYIYYNPDGDCDHYENKIYLFCLMLDFAIDVLD